MNDLLQKLLQLPKDCIVMMDWDYYTCTRSKLSKFCLYGSQIRVLLLASQELYQLSYSDIDTQNLEKYLKNACYPTFSIFKNQASDLGPVLALLQPSCSFFRWVCDNELDCGLSGSAADESDEDPQLCRKNVTCSGNSFLCKVPHLLTAFQFDYILILFQNKKVIDGSNKITFERGRLVNSQLIESTWKIL